MKEAISPLFSAAGRTVSSARAIRIVLADDHAILRDGVRTLLSTQSDIEVVGEAGDGRELLRRVIDLQPDLVLTDLSMPRCNGTEAIANIKRRMPEVKVIALTIHKAEEYVRATLKAGASGYLLKDDSQDTLLEAIRAVAKGNSYISPGVCGTVVSGYVGGGAGEGGYQSDWERLTHREREVMKLIAEGNRNKEIAALLSISLKTVEKHRANLMKKLGLRSASGVTAFALRNGLIGN